MTYWNPVGAAITGGNGGLPSFTFPVTATNLGDIVFVATSTDVGGQGPQLSGGPCAGWNSAPTVRSGVLHPDPYWSNNLGTQERSTLWWGIVTTTGASNITITQGGGAAGGIGAVFQEFQVVNATSYNQDTDPSSYAVNSKNIPGPGAGSFGPVTPGGAGAELFVAVGFWLNLPSWSLPAGFTFISTPVPTFTGYVGLLYGLDITAGGGPYAPAWTQSGALLAEADFSTCFQYVPGPVAGGNFFLLMRGQA